MRKRGSINHYRLYEKGTTDFARPDADYELHLVGNVIGNPKFANGTCVRSTTVKSVDLPQRQVSTTIGVFDLEAMDAEYAEWLEAEGFDLRAAETAESAGSGTAGEAIPRAS